MFVLKQDNSRWFPSKTRRQKDSHVICLVWCCYTLRGLTAPEKILSFNISVGAVTSKVGTGLEGIFSSLR